MQHRKEIMKTKIAISLLLSLTLQNIRAQQESMYTHYMYNTLWLNPAYAGTRDAFTITGIHRSQWVGFDGSPNDQTITMHSPFFNGKMGVGLSLLNDKIGPTKSTVLALDYAYHVQLDQKSKLSFGVKGLMNFYSNNINTLRLDNEIDNSFADNTQRILPNVGAGIYYYRERFFVGLSTPKLMENKLITNSLGVLSKEQRHYFFIMGTVLKISNAIKFKPTLFIRATAAAPIEGDITANFIFSDKFTLGAMYRSGDAVGVLLGYNVTDALALGYSFDWSMANTTGKYNSGSHEIMLRYDLVSFTKAKIKSPRYF